MTDLQIIGVEVIEIFQKDDSSIVLYKHEKNIGLVTTAHLGQYVKGKYLMWLAPDDAYCSPDAAKMVYEKAEITGVDIIHFKNLTDEPNGISIKFVPHSYCIDNSFFLLKSRHLIVVVSLFQIFLEIFHFGYLFHSVHRSNF